MPQGFLKAPEFGALLSCEPVESIYYAAANSILSGPKVTVIVNVVRWQPVIVTNLGAVGAKLDQVVFATPVDDIAIVQVRPTVAVALANMFDFGKFASRNVVGDTLIIRDLVERFARAGPH